MVEESLGGEGRGSGMAFLCEDRVDGDKADLIGFVRREICTERERECARQSERARENRERARERERVGTPEEILS